MSSRSSSVESLDRLVVDPQERAEFFDRLEELLQQKDPIVVAPELTSFYDFLKERFSGNENSELAVFSNADDEDETSKKVRLEILELLDSNNLASRLRVLENDGLYFYSLCESLRRSNWTNQLEVERIQGRYNTSSEEWTSNFENFKEKLKVIEKRFMVLYKITSNNILLLNEQSSNWNLMNRVDLEKWQHLEPTLEFLHESCHRLNRIMERCNGHGTLMTFSDHQIQSTDIFPPELRAYEELFDQIGPFEEMIRETRAMIIELNTNGIYSGGYQSTAMSYLQFLKNKMDCLLQHAGEILIERKEEILVGNTAQENALKIEKIEGFSMFIGERFQVLEQAAVQLEDIAESDVIYQPSTSSM